MGAIVTFIGKKNSGKTTLTSKVVSHLKEMGYRVAVIKSSNHAKAVFDSPESDTSIYKQIGAENVIFSGPDQMVLQTGPSNLSLTTLAHRYCPGVDIVIGEGFKDARKIAKIEVIRKTDHALRKKVSGVIAVATDIDKTCGSYIFHLDEAKEIAQFLEKRFNLGQPKDVERTALLVNGNKIPIKDFIQDCLGETVEGFVRSLKLTDNIDEIELRIKTKK